MCYLLTVFCSDAEQEDNIRHPTKGLALKLGFGLLILDYV